MPTSVIFSDVTLAIPDLAIYAGITLAGTGALAWWCKSQMSRLTSLTSRQIPSDEGTPCTPVGSPPLIFDEETFYQDLEDLEVRLGAKLTPTEFRYFRTFETRTGHVFSTKPRRGVRNRNLNRETTALFPLLISNWSTERAECSAQHWRLF